MLKVVLTALPKITQASWKVLVPLGAVAVTAVGVGTKGIFDHQSGSKARKEVSMLLEEELERCELARLAADRTARAYGEYMVSMHAGNVGRFADWLERNEKQVKRLNFKKVDGVRIRVPNIPKYVAGVNHIRDGIGGLAAAAGASASAPAAALWGVSAFASAGTGTAISSLSGIAAQNAMLAWLGGGTLAAGGGGVAAGAAVLGAVTILPALLIGGFTMGIVGAKSKTKSRNFVATMKIEIERLALTRAMLGEAERRIHELRSVLGRLSERATRALDVLEGVEFDPILHAREFLRVLQLVTAVKEVLETPVLDPESGELTETSIEILRKYA
ncbi:hypothetical protein [Pseudoclavibacter helvolus]|uniref:hypothetical protein n=1 Tax=Pseudoclavibacter helvolus TaxID=255205 RepID=UPI003734E204